MTPLRIRVTPLAGYLLALALYSSLMCLNTINQQYRQQQEQQRYMDNHNKAEDDDFVEGRHFKMRKHPRSVVLPQIRLVDDFYTWLASPETSCRKMVRFGGTYCRKAIDYDKVVCLDPDVAIKPNNCTVYSFGIGHDTTFDDMANHYGCEVFMFDPTINHDDINKNLFQREKFFHLGIESNHFHMNHHINYTDDSKTETIDGEYDTYDKIRERIGHQNRTVQYLKIDIENAEWRVLPDVIGKGLLSGVLQLAIEIHTMDIIKLPQNMVIDALQQYSKILSQLREEGFQRVSYRANIVVDTLYHVPGENRTIPTCAEVLYLRRGPVLGTRVKHY